MADATKSRLRWANAHRDFGAHLTTMPRWHQLVLVLGLLLAIGGGIGWLMSHPTGDAARPHASSTGAPVPANSRGYVDSTTPPGSAPVASDDPAVPLLSRLSPHATRVGLSILAGFVIGWLFRAFLKVMIFVALLIVGLFVALSYFGVLNIDMSIAREHYASAAHWMTDQASRLKDVVVAHLPSSGGGALGAFLGFRRK